MVCYGFVSDTQCSVTVNVIIVTVRCKICNTTICKFKCQIFDVIAYHTVVHDEINMIKNNDDMLYLA